MDRVFSVDDISDHFWPPPPIPVSGANTSSQMSRSASEWAFQRFIQEASASAPSPPSSSSPADVVFVEIDDQPKPTPPPPSHGGVLPSDPGPVALDSEEYQAFLKSKLNLACAAVAMTRVFLSPFFLLRCFRFDSLFAFILACMLFLYLHSGSRCPTFVNCALCSIKT